MKAQYLIAIIATIVAFVQADKYLSEKPSFLTACNLNDSNLSKCMASNFQTIFTHWKDGLPGLSSIGKIDPLLVKRVKIAQDNTQAISLNMELQNLLVSGTSKSTIQEFKLDTKSWTISTKINLPKLDFDSDYKVKGRVLALPLNGHGKAKFGAEKVVFDARITMKLRDDGDLTFMEVESLKVGIDSIGNFHVHVDNLFNGQTELEEAANTLFNENWRELYESLRPAIEQTISKILEDRLQKIFHYVPANYFIADAPKAAQVYG